jgi:hypothetical protein
MALIIFRSRAAAEIIMLPETARRLLELAGKTPGERGVITREEIPAALSGLLRAVEEEKAGGTDVAAPDEPLSRVPVSLRQRAFPLIQMLRAAQARGVEVTWGI